MKRTHILIVAGSLIVIAGLIISARFYYRRVFEAGYSVGLQSAFRGHARHNLAALQSLRGGDPSKGVVELDRWLDRWVLTLEGAQYYDSQERDFTQRILKEVAAYRTQYPRLQTVRLTRDETTKVDEILRETGK